MLYQQLTELERTIKARKAKLRPTILKTLLEEGVTPERSKSRGREIRYSEHGLNLKEVVKGGKEPQDKPFRALLLEREVPIEEAYTRTVVYKYNPTKVEHLVEIGVLTVADVKDLCVSKSELRVSLTKWAKEALAEGTKTTEETVEDST